MSFTVDEVLQLAANSDSTKVRQLAARIKSDAQTLKQEVAAARKAKARRDKALAEIERLRAQLNDAQRRASNPREPAKCGTNSGYYRHRRYYEPACDDCKAAHSLAERVRAANVDRRSA